MASTSETARRQHSELQHLAARLLTQKIRFRGDDRVDHKLQARASARYSVVNRDKAICGLANKAVQTHAAIGILTDANLSSDALALCRVLMENASAISWIAKEPVFRGDLYCVSSVLFRRRMAELVKQYYADRPELVASADEILEDQTESALSKVLSHEWRNWARREDKDTDRLEPIGARGIFYELGPATADGKRTSFLYDVAYFDHSHFVHSTIPSLRRFNFGNEQFFRLDFTLDKGVADVEALNTANLQLALTYANLESYAGADFQPELDAIWEQIKNDYQREPAPAG